MHHRTKINGVDYRFWTHWGTERKGVRFMTVEFDEPVHMVSVFLKCASAAASSEGYKISKVPTEKTITKKSAGFEVTKMTTLDIMEESCGETQPSSEK